MDDVTRAREWLESADSGDAESLAAQFSDSRKEALDDLRECYKDLGIMTEKWMDACERVTTLEAALGDAINDPVTVRLQMRIAVLELRLRECVGDLIWCSGSNDFSDGGQARIGWLKGPAQSIERGNAALRVETAGMLFDEQVKLIATPHAECLAWREADDVDTGASCSAFPWIDKARELRAQNEVKRG